MGQPDAHPDTSQAAATGSGSLIHRAEVPLGQFGLAALGLYVTIEAQSLGLWTTLGPGPGLLPLILGVALLGLTGVWVAQTVITRRRNTVDDAVEPDDDSDSDAGDSESVAVDSKSVADDSDQVVDDSEWVVDDSHQVHPANEALDRTYVLGIVGGLILLAALMDLLGFQISMALFLFAELMWLGRQKWWLSAVIALVGSVGTFVLFDRVLGVLLPLSSLPVLSGLGL